MRQQWEEERPVVTVIATTKEQRDTLAAAGSPRYRYVCWLPERNKYAAAFGMPLGGHSKVRAVGWAEHWARKQGGRYVAPDGWENIEGGL